MKQNNDWTDALRDRLRDAQAEPPKDGWERLAQELSAPSAPVQRPTLVRRWWPVAAAAAAVALIAVLVINRPTTNDEPSPVLAEASPSATMASEEPTTLPQENELMADATIEAVEEAEPAPASPVNTRAEQAAKATEATNDKAASDKAADDKVASDKAASNKAADEEAAGNEGDDASSEGEAATQEQQEPQDKSHWTMPSQRSNQPINDGSRPIVPSPTRRPSDYRLKSSERSLLALAFHESGHMMGDYNALNASGYGVGQPTYTGKECYYFYTPSAATPKRGGAYQNSDYQFVHQPEISFGLTALWSPFEQVSFESGVVWSMLTTNVLSGNTNRVQQVTYLGLPLYADWHFADWRHFTFYVGGGGMVERCLSARLGSWKQDEKPWQYSVGARLGISYDATSSLSLRAEPHLQYHLTETSLTTSRTAHPLSASLRLSICYNL